MVVLLLLLPARPAATSTAVVVEVGSSKSGGERCLKMLSDLEGETLQGAQTKSIN